MKHHKINSAILLFTLITSLGQSNLFGFFNNHQRAQEIVARQEELARRARAEQEQLERQARIRAEEERLNRQDAEAEAIARFNEVLNSDPGKIVSGVVCGLVGVGLLAAGVSLITSTASSH